ncbi:porin [Polaromonas jejuensis]|uniref:Porin n=1 Tax=Polaromonas jejuensis TaxID=457502 RepID=A0ABW0QAP0_9BURK|nr:porin [Polaromonas jejuensis]
MEKKILAALMVTACSGGAFAQSNVTLSGLMDLRYVHTTNSVISTDAIDPGDNNRFKLKGTEDLGGGLSAIFTLENRFDGSTGALEGKKAGRVFWQGESTVGLSSTQFGTLRLGRANTPIAQRSGLEPFEGNTVGDLSDYQKAGYSSEVDANNKAVNDGGGSTRVSNSVYYNSPNLGGFIGSAVLGAEKQGLDPVNPANPAVPGHRGYSLGARYASGPFMGLIAYERNGALSKYVLAGATYQIDALKLLVSYGGHTPNGASRINVGTVGATYNLTQAGQLRVGYGTNRTTKDDKVGLGYYYSLSKRTMLYTDVARERIKATGINTTGFDMGIQHSF